jgi:hypothetical protein
MRASQIQGLASEWLRAFYFIIEAKIQSSFLILHLKTILAKACFARSA